MSDETKWVSLLVIDTPTPHNMVYTKGAVEAAVAKLRFPMYCCTVDAGLSARSNLDVQRISFVIDSAKIESGRLWGSIRFLHTPEGELLRQFFDRFCFFVTYRHRAAKEDIVPGRMMFDIDSDLEITAVSAMCSATNSRVV